MKKLNEILKELETELENTETAYNKAEKDYNYHLDEAVKAEAMMNELRNNLEGLRKVVQTMKNVTNEKAEMPEVEDSKVTANVISDDHKVIGRLTFPKEEKKKVYTMHEKKGELWKFAPDGTVLDKYCSQHDAAMSMGITQSAVSYFMKNNNREKQILKKGWYLEYTG